MDVELKVTIDGGDSGPQTREETPSDRAACRTLAQCLTAASPELFPPLVDALARAIGCGARPFEVIAGAPAARYGPRVTFGHAASEELAREFGFSRHPWGAPRWIGVRAEAGGSVRVKAYHAVERLDARFDLPPEWPRDLYPVMAALDGGAVEIYLRKRGACAFRAFAARCLAPFGFPFPDTVLLPHPAADAFAVSLRRDDDRVTAVTLYADWRALPRDREIERIWAASLQAPDRIAYQLAVAGVRSLGVLPSGNWHAMLAWTVEAGGEQHRAVSLSAPPLAMHVRDSPFPRPSAPR